MTLTEYLANHAQLQQKWAADRNTRSSDELTPHSRVKVWWRCERGHEWEARLDAVLRTKSGCPYCTGKRAMPGETDLATLRPELLAQWDYERNTIDPRETMVSSHDRVWWRCDRGHSWQAMVFSRTRENVAGCPYCTGKKVLAGFNDLGTLRPHLAKEWYQPLNGGLKPEAVTPGSNRKVWWQCTDGHVWQAFVFARAKTDGTGCPVCAGQVKSRQMRGRARPRKAVEKAAAGLHVSY